MSYGVKPPNGIFQRVTENALENIPHTALKVDDILISGLTDTDHLENIKKVFRLLKETGAMVNKKKYMFFVKEIRYVRFIIKKKWYSFKST